MAKYKKLRNVRPKAFAGESLVAAGISAAATLTSAGINAAAQGKAAKEQANALQRQAEMQAKSMQEINDNNTALQEKQINFQASENERNRKIQQDIQTTLQMQQGALNEVDRLNSAKIQLKKGGKVKPHHTFLKGRYGNLPFKVIDGGGVQHIGITPEGYDLYEIYGNDHEHYHKTQGGKNKTGVGIKFAGGRVVEGEGNQNTNQGELMLVTPNDAKFISKHSIKGFNPTKAVLNGMDPNDAFAYQEIIKGKYKNNTPIGRNKAKYGWEPIRPNDPSRPLYRYNTNQNPWFDLYINQSIPTNNRIDTSNLNKILTTGTEVKPITPDWKDNFKSSNPLFTGKYTPTIGGNIMNDNITKSTNSNNTWNKFKNHVSENAGAYISGGANILGAAINNIGVSAAKRQLIKGYRNAGNILADAYDNLKTIDENLINKDDFKAAHSMAAVRSANVNINPEIGLVDRSTQRRLSAINKNTTSSAAALSRLNKAEVDAYDMRSKIYGDANRIAENIRQQNAQTLTQVSDDNATRDTQANQAYMNAKLNLAQYNNDIVNERIAGKAQALADMETNIAGAKANARQTNWAGYASAINATGQGIMNQMNVNAQNRYNYNLASVNASIPNQIASWENEELHIIPSKEKLDYIITNYPEFKDRAIKLLNKYYGNKQ